LIISVLELFSVEFEGVFVGWLNNRYEISKKVRRRPDRKEWYNKRIMLTENFTVSTITWARDKREENLVYDSLSTISDKNIHVVAVDGGSREEFLYRIKSLKNISVIISSKKGLQNQILESLKEAQRSNKYVFYAESNKNDFFENQLDEFIFRAMNIISKNPNTGIVLPSRTKESFSTFPSFQQQSESVLNTILSGFLGKNVKDFAYGPRIIAGDLIPYLDRLPKDIGWGWMTYILIIAKKMGMSIHAVNLDLPCPKDERVETESDKIFRLKQLRNHIEGMEEGLKFKPKL